jgi:NitT/TauT family transport system substrate-binding protein
LLAYRSNHRLREHLAGRYPKAMLQLDEVKGLDEMMQDAIAFKYLTQPLTPQQISELLQLPGRRR